MRHWSPKPRRPGVTNPVFEMDSNEEYVVKSHNPIQSQRAKDGTPHTAVKASRVAPPDPHIYIDGHDEVVKSDKVVDRDPPSGINPDEVVKSYLRS